MMDITAVQALMLITVLAAARSEYCPDGCQCAGKPDGEKYRVDCSSADIDSLASLSIPYFTTQLSIMGNRRLTSISKDDLLSLTQLDKLNLSGNAIDNIEADAFRDLQSLTKLDLTNNLLTTIDNSTFAGLRSLKRLFLTNNRVREIERGSFHFLTNVERISMSGNLFSTLPEGVFDPLTELTRIDFASENLVCDCQLKWIVKWISDRDVNIPDTQCARPQNMKDILVRNLDSGNLMCDWPVDLKFFELQPSQPQLVFAGDTLPIKCRASTDNLHGLHWYRQGRVVRTNATAQIQVLPDSSDPGMTVSTLRLNQLTPDKSGTWTCVAETAKGNVTKSINIVVAPAHCPQVSVETKKGTYSWDRKVVNSRDEQECKSGDNGAKAYYYCNEEGKWEDLDVRACKYDSYITQLLKDLSLSDFNVTTNLDMVKTLMEMLSQPTIHIADKMDVVFVARVLRRISSSYDLYSKAEIPQMVYNISSLMMNTNRTLLLEAEKTEGSCTSMRENLQTVVNFMLEHQREFSLYMDNIALQAHKFVNADGFAGLTCTAYQSTKSKLYLANNFFCTRQSSSPDLATSKKQKVDAMIHIPEEVASYAPSQRFFKLVVIIYRNDQLYQSIPGHTSPTAFVPSSVISANIIGAEVKDLTSTIKIALPRQDYITTIPKVQAVYWESSESIWKTNGCRISNTVEQTNDNLSIVECNGLRSFTLLQEEPIVLSTTESPATPFILNPQFYVGAVFLCICLLAVIFTYICSYRTINLSKKLKHALINTCFSILFLKIVFIVGIKSHDIECKIVGMAIHYFSITTIFWITVTTWNIYRKASGHGHRHVQTEETATPLPPNPMLKFYLFAWGIPVIICGITAAVNINLSENIDPTYCFIDWMPGLAAFYFVVALCLVGNFFLYVCICSAKQEVHPKVYTDEMTVLNADGFLEPQAIDDSISNTGSVKSSVADSEYRPAAQLSGIIVFFILYILMWVSSAVSIVLPMQAQLHEVLSFMYMILCIILGIFLVVFYCLARNDTRATWHTCCKTSDDPTSQPPRSNTNINVISHANAHNSLKGDDESCSSLQTSSVNNQSNPLMQIMQYHKKTSIAHSVACSNSRGDASVQGTADDGPVFFNMRQNGVAKRYWERQRASRDKGLNTSMMSVPETSHVQAHSPTNTEPTQHMSIEIQIKSHSSKQARRHRLGSTNSEPADVRNNIYHSMPKSPHQLNIPSSHRHREPTIGESRTPSEGGSDLKQCYRYPPEMWQSSVPRNYSHMTHNSYMKQPSMTCGPMRPCDDTNKQSYLHGYLKSMKDTDNSDDESHYSHRSRRSSQRSRPRHHRHRQPVEGESRHLTPTTLNESHISLQSHGTARSHQSSRSARSGYRQRMARAAVEERPLLQMPQPLPQKTEEEEKLNINHSSSDNNSSHYACTPIPETIKISNLPPDRDELVYSIPHQPPHELRVDVPDVSALELGIPEEGIYENARNIVHHERPVYTNLEEIRQQAAAAAVAQMARSPVPSASGYELPVYENLFSLNEYDTLKKQKHHVNKGLPLNNQFSNNKDLKSPDTSHENDSCL